DPGWDAAASGTEQVRALALSGSTLYVGGAFSSLGGATRNNIAALDASTGNATPWNPDADNTVDSLAVSGATVYPGGQFGTIGGQTRNRIAALDVSSGAATSWNPDASSGSGEAVLALAVSGPTVYAGGVFTTIGGQPRNNIAALDTTTGAATAW